jgi:hypothetical protein
MGSNQLEHVYEHAAVDLEKTSWSCKYVLRISEVRSPAWCPTTASPFPPDSKLLFARQLAALHGSSDFECLYCLASESGI